MKTSTLIKLGLVLGAVLLFFGIASINPQAASPQLVIAGAILISAGMITSAILSGKSRD